MAKLIERISDAILNLPARQRYLKGGAEVLDPTPHAPHVNRQKPPTMEDRISQALRSQQFQQAAANAGAETEEEANDFAVGDDYDPQSEHEIEIAGVPIKEMLEDYVKANPVKGDEVAAEPAKPLDGHNEKDTEKRHPVKAEPATEATETPLTPSERDRFLSWLRSGKP